MTYSAMKQNDRELCLLPKEFRMAKAAAPEIIYGYTYITYNIILFYVD
jgi:hypothetical protein